LGEVVSKYPDGTPATVQGSYVQGRWYLLEYTRSTRKLAKRILFFTSIKNSHEYAAKLIKVALEKKAMPTFLITIAER